MEYVYMFITYFRLLINSGIWIEYKDGSINYLEKGHSYKIVIEFEKL